jgi:acyl-CoA thioesterase-1
MFIRLLFAVIVSLMSMNALSKTIVVLGDSISAAYGIEVKQGWVSLLQDKLKETGSGFTISNESISGDTSAGGLARIDAILSMQKPAIVIIELGANDGLRGLSPQSMKSNIAEIIRRSQKAGAKVLLLGMRIPPNYGQRYIKLFYNAYKELSQETGVPYMPFILEDVALIKELMQTDGLHPNAKAQPILAEKIGRELQPLIK